MKKAQLGMASEAIRTDVSIPPWNRAQKKLRDNVDLALIYAGAAHILDAFQKPLSWVPVAFNFKRSRS